MIRVGLLEALGSSLIDVRVCITKHPGGEMLATWLRDIGFRQVSPTHSGRAAAGMLFDGIPETNRPSDLDGVDALVRPVVGIVSQLAAPLDTEPMITAVK